MTAKILRFPKQNAAGATNSSGDQLTIEREVLMFSVSGFAIDEIAESMAMIEGAKHLALEPHIMKELTTPRGFGDICRKNVTAFFKRVKNVAVN